jgi:hypothetical protein
MKNHENSKCFNVSGLHIYDVKNDGEFSGAIHFSIKKANKKLQAIKVAS